MDQNLISNTIKVLREKSGMTQAEFAEKLMVSDKTVSKWETGKGFPDISLLGPITETLHISVSELLSGAIFDNRNTAGNLYRACFKICPICGNVHWNMGESAVSCHGILLPALEAEMPDEFHHIKVEQVEDEYYVTVDHPMTKKHYISFLAAVSGDRLQFVKLYPEGQAETRFKINRVRTLYFYCNRDGLFQYNVKKH